MGGHQQGPEAQLRPCPLQPRGSTPPNDFCLGIQSSLYPEHPGATATHTFPAAGVRSPGEHSAETLRVQNPSPAILGVLCEPHTSLGAVRRQAALESFTGGVKGQSPPVKLIFLFKKRELC